MHFYERRAPPFVTEELTADEKLFVFYNRHTLLVFINIVCIYGFALFLLHLIIPLCKQKLILRRNCRVGFRVRKKFAPSKTPLLLITLREEERVKEKLPYFARRSVDNLFLDLETSSPESPKPSHSTGPNTATAPGMGLDTETGNMWPTTPGSGRTTGTTSTHSPEPPKTGPSGSLSDEGLDIELMSMTLKRPKMLQTPAY